MATHSVAGPREPAGILDRLARRYWREAMLAVAIPLGILLRLSFGRGEPLWFDETFTAVIASQPTLRTLAHWCLTELTGPVFYVPVWAWAQIAGTGDAALRMPSLAASIATPVFILWRGHAKRDVRLFWAVIVLLWLPAPILANDARPYALLFLLGCLQGAAFVAAMHEPTTRRAFLWAAPTALMGMTHYWALMIGLIQGVILLCAHPRSSLRAWPALAAFLPLAGWMAVHLPFVLRFVGHKGIHRGSIGWDHSVNLPQTVIGASVFAVLIAAAMGWSMIERRRSRWSMPLTRPRTPEGWLGLSGIAAIVLMFCFGVYQPGFAMRYLIAAIPAILFGIAWWAHRTRTDAPMPVFAAVMVFIVGGFGLLADSVRGTPLDSRHAYNLEQPSAWLIERRVDTLVFVWTDPTADRSADANIVQVATFFFDRAHRHVTPVIVHIPPGGDASILARRAAATSPHSAILWISNQPDKEDLRNPHVAAQDPAWDCRDFGGGMAVSTACRRR